MPSSPHLPLSETSPPTADPPGREVLELARRSAEAHATFHRMMTEAHLAYLSATEAVLTGSLPELPATPVSPASAPEAADRAEPAPPSPPVTAVPAQADRQGSPATPQPAPAAAPPTVVEAEPAPEPSPPLIVAAAARPAPATAKPAPAAERPVVPAVRVPGPAQAPPDRVTEVGAQLRPAPSWVEAPLSGHPLPGLEAGPVRIVDGGSGLATAVAAELIGRGVAAEVGHGWGLGGVVLLGGMAVAGTPADAIDTQLAALRVAREGQDQGVFVTVADTAAKPAGAWLGGLNGLATAVGRERPSVSAVAVECERGDRGPAAVAVLIADELTRGAGAPRVRLAADGTRRVGHPVPAEPVPAVWSGSRIGAESVIVARHGGPGSAREPFVELARETGCRLVLLGTTPLNEEPPGLTDTHDERSIMRKFAAGTGGPDGLAGMRTRARAVLAVREIRATIDACTTAGAQVRYVCMDTADALGTELDRIRAVWGPITGLVQSPSPDLPPAERTGAAVSTLAGLAVVLRATAQDPLDTLVLFSSTADEALVGAVLDRVAETEQQRRPGCLVRSLGWHSGRTGREVIVARPDRGGPTTVAVGAETHAWIDDHRPQDVAILPPAAGLGWMAAAARAHQLDAVITDFRVLRAVFTAQPQTISITTSGREVSLINGAGEPCFRARFGAPGPDREWRPTGDPARFPGSSIYAGRPLFHGPLLRSIRSLGELGPDGVVGTVLGARSMGWPDDDLPVDLAALDGAMQLSGVWAMDEHRPVLPMGMAECRIHRWGRLPGPALCVVADGRRGGLGARCDTALVGPDGELWMELLGIEFVALPADVPVLSAPRPGPTSGE